TLAGMCLGSFMGSANQGTSWTEWVLSLSEGWRQRCEGRTAKKMYSNEGFLRLGMNTTEGGSSKTNA
ncbi:unnamed protein product, partial [Dovyalis caffra]